MRPRQHDRFVLIGLCWLYGRSEFLLLLLWTLRWTHITDPVLQELCPTLEDGATVVINLSGRGDKDMYTAAKLLGWDV